LVEGGRIFCDKKGAVMNKRKLPVGIPSFQEIREDGYVYVDKTERVLQLVQSGKYFFLSRPRRFGKSVLLDTLEQLFIGNKKLFEGLYIHKHWDWDKKYPVIRLDISERTSTTAEILSNSLASLIRGIAEDYEIDLSEQYAAERFSELIKKLYKLKKEKVVILIDEYDKPILEQLDAMDDTPASEANRQVLATFYATLKSCSKYIHFIFLTGVTRLSGLTVFSGLNNIKNITLDDRFCDICGYTQEELEKTFEGYIKELAEKKGMSIKQTLAEIKSWYNGYTWDGKTAIYNPYSTLSLFDDQAYDNYWFDTGDPGFLTNYIKKRGLDENIIFQAKEVNINFLKIYGDNEFAPYTLLFQAGYLTIKKEWVDEGTTKCLLGCPNFEVEYSFGERVLLKIAGSDNFAQVSKLRAKFNKAIEEQNGDGFAKVLSVAFAHMSNDVIRDPAIGDREHFYHANCISLFVGNGIRTIAGDKGKMGDPDIIIFHKKTAVVCELKYAKEISQADKKLDEAIKQIRDKKYYEKYELEAEKILLLGIVFVDKGAEVRCKFEELG
jgi:hypothetical protein